MANKITKKEMFNAIKAVAGVAENEQMVAFIDHEIELLDKKSANKKATKTQEENVATKQIIVDNLTYEGSTVSELQTRNEVLANLSNQKVSALLRQLVEEGKVNKVVDKKKSFFSLVSETEE